VLLTLVAEADGDGPARADGGAKRLARRRKDRARSMPALQEILQRRAPIYDKSAGRP